MVLASSQLCSTPGGCRPQTPAKRLAMRLTIAMSSARLSLAASKRTAYIQSRPWMLNGCEDSRLLDGARRDLPQSRWRKLRPHGTHQPALRRSNLGSTQLQPTVVPCIHF